MDGGVLGASTFLNTSFIRVVLNSNQLSICVFYSTNKSNATCSYLESAECSVLERKS